jgi:DNA-binding beta-propeller fold protein YncE
MVTDPRLRIAALSALACVCGLALFVSSASASSGYSFVTEWGGLGSGNGQFDSPLYDAVGPSGDVYVTDFSNSRVEEFTASGAYVRQWGTYGSGDGQFVFAYGIAVSPISGNVYVLDNWLNRVQEFTASGTYVTQWGSTGSGEGQFIAPNDVAVNSAGDVYVLDSDQRVQEFTASGSFITQ